MSEENKTITSEITDGQSTKNEESISGELSDKSEAFSANMKKKMSKVKSKFGATKSNMSVKRKRSEALPPSSLVEPIIVPAITVGDLKDRYYRDLRLLVPPPDLSGSHRLSEGVVTENLRRLHDAIDEIDQMLDGINLSLFDHDVVVRKAMSGVTEYGQLKSCANLPQSDSLPKPDVGIKMKTYRLRTKQDRRTVSTKTTAVAQISKTAIADLVKFTDTSAACNDKP